MAKVVTKWGAPRSVRKGDAFIFDYKQAEYLDGAQMQYAVEIKTKEGFDTVAYCDTLEHAQLLADAIIKGNYT